MATKFTVKDVIVQDSLTAISSYEECQQYKPIIDGGIAVQLYTSPHYPELLRPTHDVDLVLYPRLTSQLFRENLGKNLADSLKQYNPEISILRHVYEVKIEDDKRDIFLIHSYKWTTNGWEQEKRNIERRVSNADKIGIPTCNNKTVHVVRSEDLISGKSKRLRKLEEKGLIDENNTLYRAVKRREWEHLVKQDLNQMLTSLIAKKNSLHAQYDRGVKEFKKALDDYVSSKDLFDVSLIIRLVSQNMVEFDDKYYDRILQDTE